MKSIKFFLFLLSLFFLPFVAQALVAVTNGNYFVGFIDITNPTTPSGFELKVDRTYNSRSQYEGIFGYGWGTDFEPFGVMHADGSIVVHENGGGDRTRFIGSFTKESAKAFSDRIARAFFEKNRRHMSAAELQGIVSDRYKREEMAKSLGMTPKIPVGTKLQTKQRGDQQTVVVTAKGFKREFGDGKVEHYEAKADVKDHGTYEGNQRVLKGVYKVTKIVDPVRKQTLEFKYDKQGNITLAKDSTGQVLRFKVKNGKVVQVTNKRGQKATYKYCPSKGYDPKKKCRGGDLIVSTDAASPPNVYKYEYDRSRNMTKISYQDGTSEQIAYWPATPPGRGGVQSVVDRNGVKTEYSYWESKREPKLHYKTTVKTTYKSGRSTKSVYEYKDKRRPDGSTYKYKMITDFDGAKTETIYNECCGQPLQIKTASGTTRFEYYEKSGLLKMKDTPTEITEWEYDDKFKAKVSRVRVVGKGDAKYEAETKFKYDPKTGNLMAARTNDGRGVALKYDSQNRIKQMFDHEKRMIVFDYAGDSKPRFITQKNVGSIELVYDKQGNIQEVKSGKGRSIAASVTSAFQNLLEIIRPAGIQPL